MALIAHYPLNGDTKDYSGYGNDGVSTGAVVSNTGKIGGSYKFDGIKSGVNIPNVNFIDMEVYSMVAWVKPLGNHKNYNGAVISSGNWNSAAWNFGLSQDNSKIDVASKGYNRYLNYPVPIGEWTHIVCVAENNVTEVYVNGNYVGQVNSESKLTSNAANTYIGRETYASGYFAFNGELNDIRIYDHALSDKEVKEIAKAKVLHYKFDEHDLTTQLVKDSSGFRNDGTVALATSPTWSEDSPVGRGSMEFSGAKFIEANHKIPLWGDFTVSFWVNTNPTNTATLGCSRTVLGKGFSIFLLNGAIRWDTGDQQWSTGHAVKINQWAHYTLVKRGNEKELYENAILVKSRSYAGSMTNLGSSYSIGMSQVGGSGYGNPLNGTVSDYRIYATALSPEDILELYQTRALIDDKGTMHAHEFIEGTGSSVSERGLVEYINIIETGEGNASISADTLYINELKEF